MRRSRNRDNGASPAAGQCAAVTTWQAEIAVGDVQQVVGILPPEVIAELLAKIVAAMPPPPPAPDDQG
jgi:hypothetical protein